MGPASSGYVAAGLSDDEKMVSHNLIPWQLDYHCCVFYFFLFYFFMLFYYVALCHVVELHSAELSTHWKWLPLC